MKDKYQHLTSKFNFHNQIHLFHGAMSRQPTHNFDQLHNQLPAREDDQETSSDLTIDGRPARNLGGSCRLASEIIMFINQLHPIDRCDGMHGRLLKTIYPNYFSSRYVVQYNNLCSQDRRNLLATENQHIFLVELEN